MDDLQSKLSQIMSDPEAMKQVQSLGKMLGLSGNNNEVPKEKEPESVQNNISSVASVLNNDAISGITRIMPVLNSMKQEDETTRLLLALRPFLSREKQKKLDEAKKMLQFLKILPLLKNGGLF